MNRPLCVVLVPFDASGERRFDQLQLAATSLGLNPIRIAQHYSSGLILEEVVRGICDAHVLIADLTGNNRNVFYELGIAHALGKRVFLVSADPQCHMVDLGSVNVFELHATSSGAEPLLNALRSFIDLPGALSPIDIFTGKLAVNGQALGLKRLLATLLDTLVLALPIAAAWRCSEDAGVISALVVPLVYMLGMSILFRTTLGQRAWGLDVVQLDRSPPRLRQRVMRPLFCTLTLVSFGATFLSAFKGPRYQAVHDRLTNTLVVRRFARVPASKSKTALPLTGH